jgi:hypothetical protein
LLEVALLPDLTGNVHLDECLLLEDITGIGNAQKIVISNCPNLITIPSLNNVKQLIIICCQKLSNLKEMTRDWCDFMNERREVVLGDLPALTDFIFCRNIYSLELTNLSGLKTCHGIGNIHELTIESCKSLISTVGIGRITGKLILTTCQSVTKLTGLNAIPKVSVVSCYDLLDFSGLGNHELVEIKACSHFKKFLEEYQTNQQHKELFSSTRQLIFEGVKVWEISPGVDDISTSVK